MIKRQAERHAAEEQSRRRALIDDYAQLKRRVDEFAPTQKRATTLKAEIESWYESEPVNENIFAFGNLKRIEFGSRRWERRITAMNRLCTFLSRKRFIQFCTFPLTVFDALVKSGEVDEADLAKFLVSEQTGSRKVESITDIEVAQASRAA